ncbi:DUF397 domain-containing protein [Micromonospora sp. NBC_01796]|uniref:DUF397 domain-containing protein n=1 Tax=Micromonospora sp. NBC_01796 TaxID=2975987 RepID=UPI002DD9CB92|nr:DUF397 domain-containing protein [Micromonospora sp. NBC_01796]WSA86841.1 DUF397 domain-containing protein [Micromonospora sp. NBC_01796]
MTDRTELTGAIWHKSSRSGAEGNCVEVADNLPHLVAVRDSKDPDGPILVFSPGPWSRFLRDVGHGTPA